MNFSLQSEGPQFGELLKASKFVAQPEFLVLVSTEVPKRLSVYGQPQDYG